jgi:hypothetical protein
MPAKPVNPFADRFPADEKTPLRKEAFNICRTQRKPMIRPNRIGNNRPGKAEPLKAQQIKTFKHPSDLPSPSVSNKLAIPTQCFMNEAEMLPVHQSDAAASGNTKWGTADFATWAGSTQTTPDPLQF